jgi:type IV pilus assembly protein PilF
MMKQWLVLPIIFSIFLEACVMSSANQDKQIAADDNVKLGLAYLQEGNTPHAKEKLLMALEEAPHWSVAKDAMAYFLEVTGDKNEAEKYYKEAISLSPDDGAVLNNYGTFLCRSHRIDEAEKMFLKAATLPNYLNTAKAYENAGLCALTIPDKNKAKYYFEKASKQDPQLEKYNAKAFS